MCSVTQQSQLTVSVCCADRLVRHGVTCSDLTTPHTADATLVHMHKEGRRQKCISVYSFCTTAEIKLAHLKQLKKQQPFVSQ